ncbi:hypothetical protein KKA08_00370 [bacterium]|nr:hypothetical protein [bacterium]
MRTIISSFVIVLLLSLAGYAVPRYAAQYNQACHLCHVDPSGGGARTLYGAQFFAYTELAVQETPFEEIGKIQPMLNDQIQIGFDARTQFYGEEYSESNSFLQMQGDVYLAFRLSDQWLFYLDKGLYSNFEVWGSGHILPANGYIKVGHFTPPYGLRLADHKVFVREKLGMQYGWQESGMEIGFHPEIFSGAVAVTNGSTQLIDADEGKAVTARADVRLPVGGAFLWLGATGRYNETMDVKDIIGGGYGALTFGPVTIMGEADYREMGNTASLIGFGQATMKIRRGVTAKLEYNFYDPDIDYESGAETMVVVGCEVVPTGFLELIPNIRYHDFDNINIDSFYEAELQLHIFF